MFDAHCNVDALDVVHTGGHAVAISEIHGLIPMYYFLTNRQISTNISGNVSASYFSIGVRGGHRC